MKPQGQQSLRTVSKSTFSYGRPGSKLEMREKKSEKKKVVGERKEKRLKLGIDRERERERERERA